MKFKYLIIILIMLIVFPTSVFAKGNVSVSSSKINITKGGSASFVVKANSCAGRIDIASSNSKIAEVSKSSIFLDNESSTIKISGVSVGTAKITVYLYDVTTYDDNDLSGKSYTINVSVSEPEPPKSNNNNLKSLIVENYKLKQINDNEFELSVMNNVNNINIIATLEDEKASVKGDGVKSLNIGKNVFEVVVTAESGKNKKYVLNIFRKDGYYLEDLASIMDDSSNINVKIDSDSVVSSSVLKKIKDGRKKLVLTYYDDNKMIYSWSIDGEKLSGNNNIATSVSYVSEFQKEIHKLTNYADGLYLNIKNNDKSLNDVKLKVFVNDKFENGKKVKLYCYNNKDNNLNLISDEISVTSQYIEFEISDCSNYFVTMSNIGMTNNEPKSFNIFLIISIILVIICCFLLFLVIKKNNKVDNTVNIDNSNKVNKLNNFDRQLVDNNMENTNNNFSNTLSVNSNIENINNSFSDKLVMDNNMENTNNNFSNTLSVNNAVENINNSFVNLWEYPNGVIDNGNNDIVSSADNYVDTDSGKCNLENGDFTSSEINIKDDEITTVNFAGYNIDLENDSYNNS